MLCCGYTLTDFPISIRLTSLALWQSNDCPSASKAPWWIWINTSCEFIMNDCITTTKQSTTKPCAYFLGYTVKSMGVDFCHKPESSYSIFCHTGNTNLTIMREMDLCLGEISSSPAVHFLLKNPNVQVIFVTTYHYSTNLTSISTRSKHIFEDIWKYYWQERAKDVSFSNSPLWLDIPCNVGGTIFNCLTCETSDMIYKKPSNPFINMDLLQYQHG